MTFAELDELRRAPVRPISDAERIRAFETLDFPWRVPCEGMLPAPMVPVTFRSPFTDEPVCNEWAVIDSGADTTSVPPSVWEALGIPDDAIVGIGAITPDGKRQAYGYPGRVPVDVAGYRLSLIVATQAADLPFPILGREDFLRAFKPTFDRRGERFQLEPYDDVEYVGVSHG